ncbi:SDR family oxidoreductase [Fictibacillus sp. FJAT-27399]|uniref:SDR family oxidoreductase n=1 Tax=Fictibacillus sp. FJAT-27399 TaxID=1729689 RepID=UPI000783EE95|nr:SDR family oxidoreductase [Fictibacillus sp. FJAT-27399]
MPKTALIAGATGLVGKELLRLLVSSDDYDQVIVLTRNETGVHHKKLIEKQFNFDELPSYQQFFTADDIFCCLGTTIKKAKTKEAFRKVDFEYPVMMSQFAAEHGASRFLVISAIGAKPDSRFFYSSVKGEMEQAVRKAILPCVGIFRPSLLTGNREESRTGEKAGEWLANSLSFLFKGKLRKYLPVSGNLVARSMYEFAQANIKGNTVIESEEMAK